MLTTELARLNVDVMVTRGQMAPLAAKEATSTIPIVMAGTIDPVAIGLVASLSRPGTNITGLSSMDTVELSAMRLQILKEILPQLSRVAVLARGPVRAALQPAHRLRDRRGQRGPRHLHGLRALALPLSGTAGSLDRRQLAGRDSDSNL